MQLTPPLESVSISKVEVHKEERLADMSYITINDLSLSFGENKVLKDISLNIEKGELITLLGPSGCGKSTLLRVFAGLETFQEGEVYLDGEEISEVAPKERNVGMVFQSYALFPNMTVFQNIAFGLSIKKMAKKEIKENVMDALKLVNLEDKADFYPEQLSGGQQQRISLATIPRNKAESFIIR